MIRTRLAFVPWLLLLAVLAGGLLWSAGSELGHTSATGTASVGGPFALTDQDGKARSDRDFRGRFMLVYFGYSFCPDVCPTTLAAVADAFSQLGVRKIKLAPLFITLDPGRDKPGVLKTYLAAFGPEFIGLTGNQAAIERTAREYRVYYTRHALAGGGYGIDHTSILYLMGPDGKFVTYYDDESSRPDLLAADLRRRL